MTAVRLPGPIAAAAREILDGRAPAVTPRDAATVMLLRPETTGGFEVYLLHRKPTMSFAPRAWVFPGGSVDPRDADEDVGWAGPPADRWGERLGAPPQLARALVCAAVRETFEESGVLLAGPAADELVADTTGDQWEADRQALLGRSVSLAQLLARRQLVLRSDLLAPWSRWITPVIERRRFDTRFFAAAMPPGQLTRDVGGEAAAVRWVAPAAALQLARDGQIELWLPTAITVAELADHGTVHDVLAAADRQPAGPRLPEVIVRDGTTWLTVPGGREFPL